MTVVSVVVPNFNHERFLAQRIETVVSQTYHQVEVIILDDCSTDNSKSIIEGYRDHPRVKHIEYNNTNSGSPFVQWAKGISMAAGEYVWIAESDDYSDPTFIEELMYYAARSPESKLLYCNTQAINGKILTLLNTDCKQAVHHYGTNELLKERLMCGTEIYNGSAVIFRRDAAVPHLDELRKYEKHGDYFLWIKIAYNSKSVFLNKPLNFYRFLPSSVTNLSRFTAQSSKEYLEIFKTARTYLHLMKPRQKLVFFDRWALQLDLIISEGKSPKTFYSYKEIAKIARWNPVFLSRLMYHAVHRLMKRKATEFT
jgi:glycosyltransferase involved in cell wall biosynthesis